MWNAAIDRHPAVVARCTDVADVVAALRLARETGLRVAVRGGGHSFSGLSTCDGGLVIDLGPMRQLAIDPKHQVVTAGPGLTWRDLTAAAAQHGLVPVGGHVADVGIGGLTLGGGVGWFARAFGLACDNMLAARVVTASGEVVRADAEENPDLLWGLRGGGGNLGIVVEFDLRLHPVGPLFAGMVMHRLDDAREVLGFLAEFAAGAPVEVNVAAALLSAPPAPFVPADVQGTAVLMLAFCHVGPVADGERAMAPVRGFGRPVAGFAMPMAFAALQHLFDGSGAPLSMHMRSHLVGPLTDGLANALIGGMERVTSPSSAVMLLPLGGATRAIAPDATAFRHRTADYCLEIGAAWSPPESDPVPHRDWADGIWQATRPSSLGVEVNHLGDEGPDRVREAYGDNYRRLADLKRTWDPDNFLQCNQNVPPA